MGGCRCVFRDCTVSTARQPRMHFFRFPVKDSGRLLKWVQMANVPHFMELPLSQQKNKAVCARHFRDECFMNYMKDKLVSTAVPTLERLKGGFAIDYEGDEPEIICIPPPTSPYMIPPPGFECPLHLDDIDITVVEEETLDHVGTGKVIIKQGIVPRRKENNTSESTSKRKPRLQKRKLSVSQAEEVKSRVKVLNVQAPENDVDEITTSSAEGFIRKFVQFVDMSEDQQDKYLLSMDNSPGSDLDAVIVEYIPQETTESPAATVTGNSRDVAVQVEDKSTVAGTKKQNSKICQDYESLLKTEQSKYTTYQEAVSKQIMQLVEALQTANRDVEIKALQLEECNNKNSKLHEQIEHLQMQNTDLAGEVNRLMMSNELHKDDLQTLSEEHRRMLELKEQLEAKIQAFQEQQVSTVSTSAETFAHSIRNTVAVAVPPSKAQLFSGIKKYLCSSMVSLVRMEMFGNAEREWKPDEKQVSVDLLRLGENVYSYFADEWRFRLPSLRQVRTWLAEISESVYEEEDL